MTTIEINDEMLLDIQAYRVAFDAHINSAGPLEEQLVQRERFYAACFSLASRVSIIEELSPDRESRTPMLSKMEKVV